MSWHKSFFNLIYLIVLNSFTFSALSFEIQDIRQCPRSAEFLNCVDQLIETNTPLSDSNALKFSFFLSNADQLDNGFILDFNGKSYRLDLTIADYIDNLYLRKNLFKGTSFTNIELLEKFLENKPLENFPKLLSAIELIIQRYPKIKSRIEDIELTFYNLKGKALSDDRFDILKKPLRIRRLNIYNKYHRDPEFKVIEQKFAQKLDVPAFIIKRFTIAKSRNDWFKNQFLEARKEFYRKYFIIIDSYERDTNKHFPFKFKVTKKDRIKLDYVFQKNEDKELRHKRRTAEAYFNAIEKRSDKRELLQYLHYYLGAIENQEPLPKLNFEDFEALVLPPYYIFQNLEILKTLLRDFSYDKLVVYNNEEHLFRIKKWIRKNREELKDFDFSYGKTGPRFTKIKEHYMALLNKFPERPWEPKWDFMDETGDPILVGSFARKMKYYAGYPWRYIKESENIVGNAAGGLIFALTGNPLFFTPTYTAFKYGFSLQKYDRKLHTLYGPLITDLISMALPLAGVFESNLLTLSMYGAATGALEAAFLGEDITLGALVGATYDLFSEIVPYDVIDPELLGGNLFIAGGSSGFYQAMPLTPEERRIPRVISMKLPGKSSLNLNELMDMELAEARGNQ